jgi:hypothetical protein
MSTMHSLYFHCFRDGFHDSICRACFITVSSQKNEVDLNEEEEQHICNLEYPWSRRDYRDLPSNKCEFS